MKSSQEVKSNSEATLMLVIANLN